MCVTSLVGCVSVLDPRGEVESGEAELEDCENTQQKLNSPNQVRPATSPDSLILLSLQAFRHISENIWWLGRDYHMTSVQCTIFIVVLLWQRLRNSSQNFRFCSTERLKAYGLGE